MTVHVETNIREIERLSDGEVEALARLLVAVVDQGASVGYLPPLNHAHAREYWQGMPGENITLFIADREEAIAGTVQLERSPKRNARHRAEVNKLLVHPDAQRLGIGRQLMHALEQFARENGVSLLHLDTREGDTANDFYRSLGWTEVGTIPQWAESAGGSLDGTVFYYKLLGEAVTSGAA